MRLRDTHGDVQYSNSTNLQRDVAETSVWVSDWSRSEQVRSVKCVLLSDTWAARKPDDLRRDYCFRLIHKGEGHKL